LKIGIIGAGFVGLTFAAVIASKNIPVLLMDKDIEKIKTIESKKTPFYEPELEELIKKTDFELITNNDIETILKKCNIIFLTIGTPNNKDGSPNLKNLIEFSHQLGKNIKKNKKNPTIVIKSTVLPGTYFKIKNILDKYSKNKFFLVSNPEFLKEGSAVQDTLNPHLIVVGSNEEKSIKLMKKFHEKIYGKKIQQIITNPQTAEMIKYTNNSFLATKITFINQIANICQNIQGINVDQISEAIGIDPRIGSQFLNAGPGYGGSCLPKDLSALIKFSKNNGINSKLLNSVKTSNDDQISIIFNIIKQKIKKLKDKRICILGTSFKENTDDIRESVSVKIIRKLLSNNVKIKVHDPMSINNVKQIFNDKIEYYTSIDEAIKKSDCVLLMTPWKEYKKLENKNFQKMNRKLVIDTRRLLIQKNLNLEYVALGVGV
jgi:UDPglucose 6-dehydrogenase